MLNSPCQPLTMLVIGCVLLGQVGEISEQKVTAFDMAAGDIYGAALGIDGELAIVCNEWDDDNGTNSGSIYAYSWNGRSWSFDQKFKPADNGSGNNFGRSIFLDGGRALVGAHWDNDKGFHSGSAYTLQHDGSQWVEQQKLTASDGQANDAFGNSVCLDGDWLAVGAWHEDQGGNNAGAAYMFRFDGGVWVQDQKLLAPDASPADDFGRYVSVSGERVLIGAWKEDQGGTDAGAAYIYRYNGAEWIFEQKLVAFDASGGDLFGWVTALQGDVAVVGAYQTDDQGTDSGAVYIYRHDGASWVFEQKLLASDGVAQDWFGYSLSMSGDRLAVAALVGPAGSGPGYGYIFRHDGSQWVERQKLQPSDGADQDKFGFQIALSEGVLLSGSWRDDDAGPDTGSAYFFRCTTLVPAPPRAWGALGRLSKRLGLGFGLTPAPGPGAGFVPGPAIGTDAGCW